VLGLSLAQHHEMLTVAQAARLWHFDSALCSAVLSRLVEQRFLVETRNHAHARA
jgi:hypothetical protein